MTDDAVAHRKRIGKISGRPKEQEAPSQPVSRNSSKEAAIASMRESWKTMPPTSQEQAYTWLEDTRNRPI